MPECGPSPLFLPNLCPCTGAGSVGPARSVLPSLPLANQPPLSFLLTRAFPTPFLDGVWRALCFLGRKGLLQWRPAGCGRLQYPH